MLAYPWSDQFSALNLLAQAQNFSVLFLELRKSGIAEWHCNFLLVHQLAPSRTAFGDARTVCGPAMDFGSKCPIVIFALNQSAIQCVEASSWTVATGPIEPQRMISIFV
jgi:hypothetical protein